jgi:hypothetical protein
MNPQATFDSWLAGQLEKGLVDIKFAISAGKDVSSAAVQGEVLQAEASIQVGNTDKAPVPTSMLPSSIAERFKEITFH